MGKAVDAHEVGFIDDEDRSLFFGGDFGKQASQGLGEQGDGEGTTLYLEGEEDLLEEFGEVASVGGDGKDAILGRVEGMRGEAKGGGFADADLSGDDTDGA